MDYVFLHSEMLYIIADCLFYVLAFANNRRVTLLCLLIKGIDLVLLCKPCFLHTWDIILNGREALQSR